MECFSPDPVDLRQFRPDSRVTAYRNPLRTAVVAARHRGRGQAINPEWSRVKSGR